MLEKVKLALRITTTAFDGEIEDLISAALADLGIAGVITEEQDDPLITRAVITFCKANFGEPDEYDRPESRLRRAEGAASDGDRIHGLE